MASLLGEHAHIHAVTLPDQFIERAGLEARKSGPLAVPDEDLCNTPRPRKLEQGLGGIIAFQDLDRSARIASSREPRIQRGLIFRRNVSLFHVGDDEFSVKSVSHNLGFLYHLLNVGSRRDADQYPLVCAEMLVNAVAL